MSPPRREPIAALVGRPGRPHAARVVPAIGDRAASGHFHLERQSRWTDDDAGCPVDAPCIDIAPARSASLPGEAGLLVQPRCFGAASRDACVRA